jgi:CubicO group peptidase (beta-lactamase class C family)
MAAPNLHTSTATIAFAIGLTAALLVSAPEAACAQAPDAARAPAPDAVLQLLGKPDCATAIHARLTPQFQQSVPVASWSGWCQGLGTPRSHRPRGRRGGWHLFVVETTRGTFHLEVAYDAQGRISGLAANSAPPTLPLPPASVPLEQALATIRQHFKLPALAVLVWKNGQVLVQAQTGVRRWGHPEVVGADDRWHLGSDTKAMTATLAAILVESGKLRWSSTLGEVLGDWKDLHPAMAKVTLDMLLAHRGGLPANASKVIWKANHHEGDVAGTRRAVVRASLRETPSGVGNFSYSNLGYMTAGVMLERASGLEWEKLIQQRLFAPLGMRSCGFGPPGSASIVDQPWPHRGGGSGEPTPLPPGPGSDNPLAVGPAGNVHCSLRDWSRFVALHVGERAGGTTLVSDAALAHLHQPWPGGDYARGWGVRVRPWAGGPVLLHAGSNTLNFARVAASPGRRLFFLAATNRGDDAADQAIERAMALLIERYGR